VLLGKAKMFFSTLLISRNLADYVEQDSLQMEKEVFRVGNSSFKKGKKASAGLPFF
jgi:hypothetical protein